MKKVLFFIAMIIYSMLSLAQANYGEFSLPHTTDLVILKQFVGQRVKVMKYKGYAGVLQQYMFFYDLK